MTWFKNLKIRVKLIICFGIAAIFTIIVGLIGIYEMRGINNSLEKMFSDDYQADLLLSEVDSNNKEIQKINTQAVYEQNPDTLQSKLTKIAELTKADDQIFTELEKKGVRETETAHFIKVKDTLATYRDLRAKNIELIKSNHYEQAIAELSDVLAAAEINNQAIHNLIDESHNAAEKDLETSRDDFMSRTIIIISVGILGTLFAVGIGLYVASLISKPLRDLVHAANKMTDGDLDVNIDIQSKDEVGLLSQAFKTMSENLNDVISNIHSAAEQVSAGSKQVSDSSVELAQGATEQASSIEQLTASIEEISSQTNNNAQNAGMANEIAETAKHDAELGNEQMTKMLSSMEDINEASTNISKIIKVIDEIAFQTNILALNAAVEAARAGQHGKGFAVVAEEVRNLAARSADAAKETTDLIEGSIRKVEDGTKIASATAEALNKIVAGISKVASLVGNIANASNEQASGIGQVNQGIMQISQVVQANSATAEESAAASEELSSQSELLNDMVKRFKLKRGQTISRRENISPAVLRMLEDMEDNRSAKAQTQVYAPYHHEKDMTTETIHTIDLSDKEFGKY